MLKSMFLVLITSAGGTAVPSIVDCNIRSAKEVVLDVKKLPKSVQVEMDRYAPKLASRNGQYQKGDLQLGTTLPVGRFLGGAYNGKVWVVVYENGITGMLHALTFGPYKYTAKGIGFRIVPNAHLVGPMCDTVLASFAEVRSPG